MAALESGAENTEALLKQEIIEGIIPESNSHRKVCKEIKKVLTRELKNLTSLTEFELVKRRKERYAPYSEIFTFIKIRKKKEI